MKKLFALLLCFPLIFSCGGQTSPTNLNHFNKDVLIEQFNRDMSRCIEASNNKDWDKIIDITHPKLFDLITKEQMLAQMEGMFMYFKDFQMIAENITDISSIENYEGDHYTSFFYDNEIVFTFYNSDDFDNILPTFIDEYGEDNVKAFRTSNSVNITARSSQIAVLEENSSEWKYIEWQEGYEELLYEIVPASVIEKLTE